MNQFGVSNAQNAAEAGFLGGLVAALGVFALIYCILVIIACWKIFEKAGEPGWKSLIPIYNQYILYKIVGMKKWFWITLCVSFAVGLIVSLMGFNTEQLDKNEWNATNVIALLLYIAMLIFAAVVSIVNYCRLSKVFGHGIGFTLGLIFLTNIFLLILGFDKSKFNKKMAGAWIKDANEDD